MSSPAIDPLQQVVFIDSNVPDLQDLLNGLAPGVQAFVLDPASDGLQQIADILAANDLTGLSSISIVGHGASGEIDLGSTVLDESDLSADSSALAQIGAALGPDGSLQLYACDTASGATGQQFIADLSQFAGGVGVAAATQDIGQTESGENWTLDATTGAPADPANAPFTEQALANFQGTLASTITSQLWFGAQGATGTNPNGESDDQLGHINSDGTTRLPADTSSEDGDPGVQAVGLDTAAGLYFELMGDGRLVSGHITNNLQTGESSQISTTVNSQTGGDIQTQFEPGPGEDDEVNTFAVDPVHHIIYLDLFGQTDNTTAIIEISYNATTGVMTSPYDSSTGTLTAGSTLISNTSTSGTLVDATAMHYDIASGKLYYIDDDLGFSFNGGADETWRETEGIYVVDTTSGSPTATLLSSQTQFEPGPTSSEPYMAGMAVDAEKGLIYFTVDHPIFSGPTVISKSTTIYWMPITGGTATAMSLPMGVTLESTYYFANGSDAMTLDDNHQDLYITDGGNANGDDTGNIIRLQLSADGQSFVAIGAGSDTTASFMQLDTNNDEAATGALLVDSLPTLANVNGTSTHAVEQGASITLLTGAPTITDPDNASLASATVQITGGTFSTPSSDENSAADDHLGFAAGNFFGSTIEGTSITFSYDSATETLTLSGDDTLAHYQTALSEVQYFTTGDNPTNYGNDTSRTITWQVNDGAAGNPVGPNTQTTTINIDAVNDAPVISVGAGNSISLALTETNAGLSGSHTLTVTDPDDESQTISTSYVSETGPTNGISTATLGGFFSAGTPVSTLPPGETGTITYTFNSGGEPFNYLRAGQQLAITYDVHDVDAGTTGTALSTDQQVTVTITGTNDPASITSVANPATFAEAPDAHAQVLSGSGSLSISDLDVGDTETASVTGNGTAELNGGAVPGGFAANIASLLSSSDLSFDPNVLSNGGAQTISFTYSSTAANLDFLNSTDVLTVTFDAQVNDGTVTSATKPITITIDGTNDAPVITSNGGGATTTISIPENTTAVTTVTATDVDEGDTQTYSILSDVGTDFGEFTINSSTGVLAFTSPPDFEHPTGVDHNNSYLVDVQVSDGHGGTATQDITVDVTNVNEAPAFSQTAVTDSYTENGAALSLLGAITLSDPDNPANFNGGSLTVTITDPVAGDRLDAVGGSGLVISGGDDAVLNGVDLGTVTSGGLGSGSTAIAIALNASATPAEAEALTQAIGFDSTSDDPTSATRSISVVFNDGGNTGSGGPLTGSVAVTMDVTAVNDPPTVTAPASYAGTPNTPITINGITFGDVDSEGGQELATFSVAAGTLTATAPAGITLGGTATALTATGTIDNLNSFISGNHLTFTGTTNETLGISIDDEGNTGTGLVGGLTTSTSANIVVDNPPSAPTDSDTATPNRVTEGAPVGTYVGLTASSTDVEDGTNLAYSLTVNPNGFFAINSVSGQVTVSAAGATGIDYESSGGAYTITVAATDSDNVSTTSDFTINVVDVAPSVPVDTDATANAVTEGAPAGTPVGITAFSTDPNGGTVTYSLTTDPGNFFQIGSNGVVSVSAAGASGIDFESSGGAYAITVEAADQSGLFNTANFTINVLDAAPSVPVDNDATANAVIEGAPAGTYVGLTAASMDPNGGTVTYSLSSDPGNFFQIDPSSGAVSVSGAGATGIDFESSGGSYTIAVEAADPSGLFNTANFTINVLDVAPSVPTDSDTANANQVTEGATAGTYVGLTAASMDPNGGTVTYSLSSDPGNLFQIDPSSGAVSVSGAGATGIDFESSGGAYTIAVEAADSSGLFNTANFTINVLDVAPSVPVDSDTANANQVAEGAASGTYVGLTAASMDPNGGAVTYSLSSDPGNFFQIDPSSGAVSVSAAGATGIDFETSGGSYAITVEAADPLGLFNTADFTINVLDVAPSASGFNATAAEAVQGGSAVTLLTAPPPTLGDVNSADLAGATVTISGFQTGDLLSANTAGTNISASYAGGVLTLSGNDTFADYQNVLASVTYQDTGADTTTVGHASRTFIWTVTDGTLNSTPPATTTLLVDRPPTQTAHNVAIVESVSTGTISAGDSDPDGDSVSVTALTGGTVGSPDAGTYGTLTINLNDTYSYTAGNTAAINAAASGSHPTDTFTYTVSDGQGGTALETLTFSIDRLPTSAIHNVTLVEGTSTSTATAGDSDPDGDGVTVTAVTGGAVGSPLAGSYGTLTLNVNDTYSYDANNTAAINAAPTNPTDTFTYTVSDGHGGTAIETLAFTVTRQPLVTATAANVNATPSENFAASALFSASSPDGTPINSYQVEDENSGSSQGFWVLNGAVLTNGQLTTLSAAQLSELSFVAGASASTSVADTLEVAASNAAGLGAFTTFTVTASKLAPGDVAPTVTAASVQIAPNQSVAGSSLFSASVPQGETIVSYEVEDTTTDSGHWMFNGVVEPTNQVVDVTVAQLAQLSFDTGYGSDTLKVRANDGTQWGSFTSFTVTPPPNAAPPAGSTDTLMMLRNSDGAYEFYDIGHNTILLDGPLGQINPALQVAGVGGFNGADTADLLMRDPTTGVFTLYDVSNNNITGNVVVGQVGLEWTVSGFGDFSTRANETDMLMRNSNTGQFEVYDIANNAITFAGPMGQVGLEWSIAGFGDFSTRANETDMLMRNSNTGAFEVYDIVNNNITFAGPMGQVGLEWSIAGFGDFSTRANETDMLMRNSNTGQFEVYDIVNNAITSFAPMGQVGLEWTIAGFGDFSGNANETDMLMRNSNTGVFELYDINNNTIAPMTTQFGQVGLEWSISGVSATPASAPPATQLSGIAADPAGAAPSSATAQLTQAMASFAPSAGAAATSSPLGQSSPLAETPNLFAAASRTPSATA